VRKAGPAPEGNGSCKPTRAELTILYNQGTEQYQIERTLARDEQMLVDFRQADPRADSRQTGSRVARRSHLRRLPGSRSRSG
jgi:hypothetical protein